MNVYYIEKNNNNSLQTASQVPTVTNNQHSKTAMPTTKKVGCTQLPTTYKLLIFIKTSTQQKGCLGIFFKLPPQICSSDPNS